jgi:succinate-semialdehyde dehydrogenase / glutarate-semialdehyde dehydrogenase
MSSTATAVDLAPKQLYIGGEWRDAENGTLPVENPATGEVLCEVADASPDDAVRALNAAVAVQEEWAATSPRVRSDLLRAAYEHLIDQADTLAMLMTLEMGKPLSESRGELSYAAEFFRWYAEEAVRIDGRYSTAPDGRSRLMVSKQPVGPCLLITPWNFPLAMGTRKIGPAIAAGCTMVVKPAKQTPLSMLMLAKILEDVGVPAGVVNVVTTSRAGTTMAPVLSDRRLRKLSFTGSTEVGRTLYEAASTQILRISMELGGNAPFLVFEDADLDAAVAGAMVAKLRNGGAACTAANRFYVHERLYAPFVEALANKMAAIQVGPGTDSAVGLGPLIDRTEREKVAELVGDATARGARVATGGANVNGPGYFFEPTVLADVPVDARVLREEIFGPVAPIVPFTDDDFAVASANDTEHGLVAYVFTRDLNRALRVTERLETGMIGLNQGIVSNPAAPFGGVKHSGIGREGGHEGIDEYLNTKYVAIAS